MNGVMFELSGGTLQVQFPKEVTNQDIDDAEQLMAILFKKLRRQASEPKPIPPAPTFQGNLVPTSNAEINGNGGSHNKTITRILGYLQEQPLAQSAEQISDGTGLNLGTVKSCLSQHKDRMSITSSVKDGRHFVYSTKDHPKREIADEGE